MSCQIYDELLAWTNEESFALPKTWVFVVPKQFTNQVTFPNASPSSVFCSKWQWPTRFVGCVLGLLAFGLHCLAGLLYTIYNICSVSCFNQRQTLGVNIIFQILRSSAISSSTVCRVSQGQVGTVKPRLHYTFETSCCKHSCCKHAFFWLHMHQTNTFQTQMFPT